ncbi:alpha/beta hydrolase [Echinicola jeungdonensis]|uniref:Alpha/beta hydrolase fold domain-containing protein n=1 Tax=Echinicola jeungdonensis TaxID=709343 RepID=A0ABV5J1F1_9BACT|nr:alpha/beta hydrolase [Echinicola jeungdonensis]MDN3668476.1 alpha/beta hydrolase [Echinicola jeungdonensis]
MNTIILNKKRFSHSNCLGKGDAFRQPFHYLKASILVSFQSKLFNLLLKVINKKTLLKKQFRYNKFDLFTSSEPSRQVFASCNVHKYRIHEHKVFTLSPKGKKTGTQKHILYLHGGAYVQGFARPHWNFLSLLVNNTHCTITAPDYPLAPAHTYRHTFAMVKDLYNELIKKVDPAKFILMGDSAGGGLALALAQLMKNEQMPQPSQIILLSPWLDLSLTNPEIKDIDPSDLFLGVEGLQLAGKAYAGNTSPGNYLLSPINGSLEGLGKISIFMGSREILVADARKLKSMAHAKGIALNYHEFEGMFHTWMLLNLPESKKAKKLIIELINDL